MALPPLEKAVSRESSPGGWDLCTLTLAPFIERSPGTSCKKNPCGRKRPHRWRPSSQPTITCRLQDNESRILIDDVDPAEHLRDDRVNESVARVSQFPVVRQIVGKKLHEHAQSHDLIVEGRDIGSVVFPDTPYKFYVDASPEVRLRRRAAQGERDEIAMRDHADFSRPVSPLVIAEDAYVIDTSHLTIRGSRQRNRWPA